MPLHDDAIDDDNNVQNVGQAKENEHTLQVVRKRVTVPRVRVVELA